MDRLNINVRVFCMLPALNLTNHGVTLVMVLNKTAHISDSDPAALSELALSIGSIHW